MKKYEEEGQAAEAIDKSTGTKECADSCRYMRSKTYVSSTSTAFKATPA